MGIRGKRSSASLTVVNASPLEVIDRPQAPDDLTDEQAREWRAVVDRLPADWFQRENYPLLAQYCRHVVAARRVADMLGQVEDAGGLDVDTYDKLLKMQEREGRAMSSLATRLRLTQQSQYDPKRKKTLQAKKPWE